MSEESAVTGAVDTGTVDTGQQTSNEGSVNIDNAGNDLLGGNYTSDGDGPTNSDTNEAGEQLPWYGNLSPEYHDNPNIQKYGSMDEYVKGTINLYKKLGEKGLEPLGEDATEEERSAFFDRIGRPQSAEDYTWKPQGFEYNGQQHDFDINQDDLKETLEFFHSEGLTDRQMNAVMNRFAEHERAKVINGFEDFVNTNKEMRAEAINTLSKEWGPNFNNKMTAIDNVVNKFGLGQFLMDNGLANNIGVIRMFDTLVSKVSEGALTGDMSPAGGGFTDTVKNIKQSEAYRDTGHPDHESTMTRLADLYQKHNSR